MAVNHKEVEFFEWEKEIKNLIFNFLFIKSESNNIDRH